MEITLRIPEELAARLQPLDEHLPQILELGLRELSAGRLSGFKGVADVLETLAELPSAEEVLALRPSKALRKRMQSLLEKNRRDGLTAAEAQEWQHYQYLEHLVRLAKARAYLKLKNS